MYANHHAQRRRQGRPRTRSTLVNIRRADQERACRRHCIPASGTFVVILVPIKNTAQAKQRLASLLDQPSRTKLAQAMLSDVMAALNDWKNRPAVGIVTGDPFATKLALEYGFEVIADPDNPGETGAIEMATRICVARGIDNTLVIPADIPLIQSSELEKILANAPAQGSVLVP